MEQQHGWGLRPPRVGRVARSTVGCKGTGAAAPPSWRWARGGGVEGSGAGVEWRGIAARGGSFYSRAPACHGRGAGEAGAVLGWRWHVRAVAGRS